MSAIRTGTVVFGLSLALLAPQPAQAVNCEKNPSHPQCQGGEPPSTNATRAQWGGSRIMGDGPRNCILNNSASANYGIYSCQQGNPVLSIDLDGLLWDQTARRGDPALCDSFDIPIEAAPNSAYEYHWTEPCTSAGSCTIFIQNWFFENHGVPGVGLIRFWAYADADPPFTNANPFADQRDLTVDQIVVRFFEQGKNKLAAECVYPDPGGTVTFHSSPLP